MTFGAYPKMKDSGIEWIGQIPEYWDLNRVKFISKIIYGDSLPDEKRNDGEIPVYGSNGIVGYHNESITKSETIVIGRKGSVGEVNFSGKPCFPIDTTFYIDKTSTQHDLRWLFYVLKCLGLTELNKDSAVPGISREEIYNLIIPFSFKEENQISDYLDKKTKNIEDEISKNINLIKLLNEKRQAKINHAVTKGLDPAVPMKDSGIEWIGKIPKHWEVKKLKRIAKLQGGYAFKSKDFVDEGINVLKIANVSKEKIDWSEKSFLPDNFWGKFQEFQIKKNDLILAMTRPIISFGLKISFFKDDFKCLLNQRVGRFLIEHDINPNYFFHIFCSQFIKENIRIKLFETVQPNISSDDVESIIIPLPPNFEQEKISQFLYAQTQNIDSLILKVESQIKKLQEFRQSLISSAVTGKICVIQQN